MSILPSYERSIYIYILYICVAMAVIWCRGAREMSDQVAQHMLDGVAARVRFIYFVRHQTLAVLLLERVCVSAYV